MGGRNIVEYWDYQHWCYHVRIRYPIGYQMYCRLLRCLNGKGHRLGRLVRRQWENSRERTKTNGIFSRNNSRWISCRAFRMLRPIPISFEGKSGSIDVDIDIVDIGMN